VRGGRAGERNALNMALLSADSLELIDREVAKYPADQKQSAVMSALAIVQDENGWLSADAIDAVAHYLGMPPVWVYEVATFYNMYNLKPLGKHKVVICTNLPCALSGAEHAAGHLQQQLGIGFNATSADGVFTLKEGECFGACGDAPVLLVNNKRMCVKMAPARCDELLDELRAAAARGEGTPNAVEPVAPAGTQGKAA
jgi:NADH-quinone oxidoreductase subunit E